AVEKGLKEHFLIKELSQILTTKEDELVEKVELIQKKLKEAERKLEEIKRKSVIDKITEILKVIDKGNYKVAYGQVEGFKTNELRDLADVARAKLGSSVVMLVVLDKEKGKVNFIVAVSKDLTDKIKAGDIVKQVAQVLGGKGGGRPDMAQGGGTEINKINEAFKKFKEITNL
ncbi:MAG TPA: alanine--tRNA ligase, partial [Hydrogenothermaceae bacterium]|nr:alanine--tRNA ligase [Hydrogenothermaceae bacterium]